MEVGRGQRREAGDSTGGRRKRRCKRPWKLGGARVGRLETIQECGGRGQNAEVEGCLWGMRRVHQRKRRRRGRKVGE